jgi:hypothetical protein
MKIDLKKDLSMPKLSVPKIGRPSMPGKPRGINAPRRTSRGPQIKAPKFASDLYEDLRDRHLLPLVALLIVAIVAAPIVFKGKSGSDEPVATANIETGETGDAAFTVVPAETSLRSPQKRLGHRHALNPFRQAPASIPAGQDELDKLQSEVESVTESSSSSSGSSSESFSSESTVTESPAEIPPVEAPSSESTPVESTPPSGSTEPEKEVKTTRETTTKTSETTVQEPIFAVTMKVGFDPKKLTTLEEVQPMTKLPSEKNPAILYIGLSPDNKRAMFLLTTKVTAYYGAAHCVLDKLSCELVEIAPGKSSTFEIGLDEEATRFKIAVESIQEVEPESASAKETTKTETRSSAPNSLKVPDGVGAAQPLQ